MNLWSHDKKRIKGWYWPQGLLSLPADNSHKSWETPSDKTSVSSASKPDFLTSSIVIPGQCNFSCSREERMKASPRPLKTEFFGYGSTPLQKTGMFGGPEVSYHQTYSAWDWLSILRTPYPTQNLQRKHRTDSQMTTKARTRTMNPGLNKWKTEEALARAAVNLETERIKGSNA